MFLFPCFVELIFLGAPLGLLLLYDGAVRNSKILSRHVSGFLVAKQSALTNNNNNCSATSTSENCGKLKQTKLRATLGGTMLMPVMTQSNAAPDRQTDRER